MKYCEECGELRSSSDNFCSSCGKKFTHKSSPNEEIESSIEKIFSQKKQEQNDKKRQPSIFALYVSTLKNYASTVGRASRKEYWSFILLNWLFYFIIQLIETFTAPNFQNINSTASALFNLIMLIPTLSVAIRRMHDLGISGWWILLPIGNLFLLLKRGETEKNRYGLPVN